MRFAALAVAVLVPLTAAAGEPTARFAPDQLEMAQESMQRAREAMLMGESSLAGQLAWEASVDARLAWGMSDAAAVRAPAAAIAAEAARLVQQAAATKR